MAGEFKLERRREIVALSQSGLSASEVARVLGAPTDGVPALTVGQVLTWARAYLAQHGRYPSADSGPVAGVPGQTWQDLDRALRRGSPGLPGGSSLPQLLNELLGKRERSCSTELSLAQILHWADRHHQQTGAWPQRSSGPVIDAPGETWHSVDAALCVGGRGLGVKTTLARLLIETGRRAPSRQAWAPAEDALLGTLPDAELAGRLGRTPAAVKLRRAARGIPPPCR